jgi:hypothetical protein
MHLAPPPSPGSRIQELGDTLVVRFRPRRSWGDIVFLGFWLTGWTLGGIAVLYALTQAGWGGRAFLLVWLCGWLLGEIFAAKEIAWQLGGRELLLVTPNQLEIRKEIGPFTRRQLLHVLSVDAVRAERVPTDEEEKSRHDYRLAIVTRDDRVYVGEGMDEREAKHTALVVESRVHPRPRWTDEGAEFGFAAPPETPETLPDQLPAPEPPVVRGFGWQWVLARIFPALVGATLIAIVALIVLLPLRHKRDTPPVAPPPAPVIAPPAAPPPAENVDGPPSRTDFDDPRAYAVATTRFALKSARNAVESTPTCGTRVTWTTWSCRARARSRAGPFAGQRLVYRCYVQYQPQPVGRVVQTIECGPENPPPIAP